MTYVIFHLNNECFALPVTQVREVIRLPDISFLPQVPDFVDGMISLRGHSIAVMDLRKKMHQSISDDEDRRYVLVAVTKDVLIGLIVDRVSDVREFDESQIDRADQILDKLLTGKDFIGVYHEGEKMISILNLDQLFDVEQLKNNFKS